MIFKFAIYLHSHERRNRKGGEEEELRDERPHIVLSLTLFIHFAKQQQNKKVSFAFSTSRIFLTIILIFFYILL